MRAHAEDSNILQGRTPGYPEVPAVGTSRRAAGVTATVWIFWRKCHNFSEGVIRYKRHLLPVQSLKEKSTYQGLYLHHVTKELFTEKKVFKHPLLQQNTATQLVGS